MLTQPAAGLIEASAGIKTVGAGQLSLAFHQGALYERMLLPEQRSPDGEKQHLWVDQSTASQCRHPTLDLLGAELIVTVQAGENLVIAARIHAQFAAPTAGYFFIWEEPAVRRVR